MPKNAAQLSVLLASQKRRSFFPRDPAVSSAWIKKGFVNSPERDQRRSVGPGLGSGAY
ncbi:hypothetical protein KCP73_08035 [Salmonella enterica subsp. enterica]|nr:hypothetical protein KCP73_08035 [Salmonella enterica subsp. enterica]